MSAKDTKKVVYLDAASIEELQACRRHFRLGSQLAAVSRIAQIVIHEAAEGPSLQEIRLRPLRGPTQAYHFVLGVEGQERLERLTQEYAPFVVKEPGQESGDRRFRFTAAALLRYLIGRKATQIMSAQGAQEGVQQAAGTPVACAPDSSTAA